MDSVTLKIQGVAYSGWKSISIKRNLKSICGSFSLSVTDSWNYGDKAWRIRPGDLAEVYIENELVITGYIDEVSPSISAKDKSIKVDGRDKAADLVDCSADQPATEYRDLKAERIAQILCTPFKIKVSTLVSTGESFDIWTLQKGETVGENLTKLARRASVLLTSDVNGNIVFTRNGLKRSSGRLVMGENVLSGGANFDHKNRFSIYKVITQANGGDLSEAEDEASTNFITGFQAVSTDQFVRRYRPLIIVADSEMKEPRVRRRAIWEAKVRAAQATQGKFTVQGWRQPDGRLWQMNEVISVSCPWLALETDMLITSVEFSLSESGTITSLETEPKDAYLPEPLKEELEIWSELTPKNVVKSK